MFAFRVGQIEVVCVVVAAAGQVKERASIIQGKTRQPVSFEITKGTRRSLARWMDTPLMVGFD